MKSNLFKAILVSTILAGNSLPSLAMEADPESSKSIPMAKKHTFEVCTKFQHGPEESFAQSSKILHEQPDHLESLLDLYDIANSYLNSENADYQRMASLSFDRLVSFVGDETQVLRKRLRIAVCLASLTMRIDYSDSLRYSELIIGNELPYYDGGLWWTLDTLLEAEDANTDQKLLAHRLLMQYAQKFRQEKLGTFVQQYIEFLKEKDLKGKKEVLEPLNILEEHTEKNPSHLSFLWLAKAYECLYGLEDHLDEDGNLADASLTREAYKSAALYYPESKEYENRSSGYYYPHLNDEYVDFFSFLGKNRSVFFEDPFEFYIFVQKVFEGVKSSYDIRENGFRGWLTETTKTDLTEEGKIIRLLYGHIYAEEYGFEEGSYGAFIAEGLKIEELRNESLYLSYISKVEGDIKDVVSSIEKSKRLDPSGKWPLYVGKSYWDYEAGVNRYPHVFSSVKVAESYLAELLNRKQSIVELRELNASERKRRFAKRKEWLESQCVETVYEWTRAYKLAVQNDFPLFAGPIEDYRLILEALTSRGHEEAKVDLEALNDKFRFLSSK